MVALDKGLKLFIGYQFYYLRKYIFAAIHKAMICSKIYFLVLLKIQIVSMYKSAETQYRLAFQRTDQINIKTLVFLFISSFIY